MITDSTVFQDDNLEQDTSQSVTNNLEDLQRKWISYELNLSRHRVTEVHLAYNLR